MAIVGQIKMHMIIYVFEFQKVLNLRSHMVNILTTLLLPETILIVSSSWYETLITCNLPLSL